MSRFLLGAGGFAAGIAAASFFHIPWAGIGFLALVACALFSLCALQRKAVYTGIGILLIACSAGMARAALQPQALPEEARPLIGEVVTLEGVVVADPDLRESSQRLTIEVTGGSTKFRILAVAPSYPEVLYGETVRAAGTLELPQPFDTVNGRVFRYDKFLAKDGVFAVMQNARIEITAPRNGFLMSVRGALSDFKFAGLAALAAALPEPQASLAGGLILGGKQGLGKSLLDDFIRAGLVHIVVLSGYNVMIVADAVFRALCFLAKRTAAFAAALVIIAFVFSAGAGAASVRAGIMASIALYGRASGRKYDACRALMAAGLLMLLWNPLTLAYDPGFQLSFIATLGLIFGAPVAERWLSFVRPAFLKEIAASTIAAQIAVLPLLLYQNGLFSLVALPANLLVLPFVPAAMLASAVAGVAGFLAPPLAPIFAFPAYLLLSYITGLVEFAAHLPFSAIALPAFPFAFVLSAYALIALLLFKSSRPQQ